MEHLINARVRNIQISGIRQFFNKVAQYPDAIQLTIGQPDFSTPEHIKRAGQQAIEANQTSYTANAGLPQLREAAARFVEEKYGLSYDPATEVVTTIGASQAIDITLRTILEPGTEVILPGPVYPAYEPLIRLCGAEPVYVDTRDTQFKIRAERLEDKLTERTRCVILPYPSNPTGCVLDASEIKAIAEVLQERDVFVLSDEIYSELTYDQPHVSIASIPGMREKTIVINGLSKSHAMTGWRIGFAFAPAYLTQHMLKVHQYNVSCASSISQHAAVEALNNGKNDAHVMREAYRRRRDYVYNRLVQMGMDVIKPEGAFYLFPSIKKYGLSSSEFALKLLEQQQLAVVPGDAFSAYGEGFIRLSYAYGMDVLEEGCRRLEQFVSSLS
ncbi:aminotransferase class I and II [Caldalkalibacillus thermarum TA2.A1]|uniref:Aminotransferase n=1 Tax=Caldalkalibacillus thermarum (strain TA2.A1) TaxID=986075 RepID=F5L7V8_CALTT|nr:aminotransferase A [Caldalkalibacillus thermarum]EGL82546.1 aminotransferase class I and II [Caldalkalibacillus thermarum TA2.A1]QZT34801.1 aminotransferase A [Caldalkalibacillus thermarum TA2.A1]